MSKKFRDKKVVSLVMALVMTLAIIVPISASEVAYDAQCEYSCCGVVFASWSYDAVDAEKSYSAFIVDLCCGISIIDGSEITEMIGIVPFSCSHMGWGVFTETFIARTTFRGTCFNCGLETFITRTIETVYSRCNFCGDVLDRSERRTYTITCLNSRCPLP